MKKQPNKIIYPLHDAQRRSIKAYFNMLASGHALQAEMLEAFGKVTLMPQLYTDMAKRFAASSEMLKQLAKDYPKPEFGLKETMIDDKAVSVTPETVKRKDFGSLLHFKRDTQRNDPKVLIVAPMSGHYATQMRETIAALLPHHDVYITDWENARDVPLSKGNFGFNDYVRYVQEFLAETGPETHVIAISQSSVPVLAAVALLAGENAAHQPLSMTLMCGPIDTRAAETVVTRFVKDKPAEWFADNLIASVPENYEGAGRAVYPGFLQLAGLLSINPEGHVKSYMDLFSHLHQGNDTQADKIKKFYDEYLAVCDLADQFYLETIEKVFLKQELAQGSMAVDGEKVDPAKIKKTALLTVEGTADQITAPGQTVAAHPLCSGLGAGQRHHYLQKDASHYGVFSGKHWQEEIMPRIAGLIRKSAGGQGIAYDPIPHVIAPEEWVATGENKAPEPKPKNSAP